MSYLVSLSNKKIIVCKDLRMEQKQAIQLAASTLKKMGDRLQKQTEERNKLKKSNSMKKTMSTMLSSTAKWKR